MSLCINIERLTKSYGQHLVVKDVNLSIDEGEIVVCQGPSGIGKSTFLRCLTYLENFQKGEVRVGDTVLRAGMNEHTERQTIQSVRKQLGFVFQFFNLFPHLTVLENVTIGPTKVLQKDSVEAERQAQELLDRVKLKDKAYVFPNTLSGGQKQRVAIARALAMKPKALLLDEPTSSLDPDTKHEIVEVLEALKKEKLTMLIVTHEPVFVERIATRIIKFAPLCAVESDKRM